ncbi:LysM peptidoglycan-binding domain-containing protein [Roseomonas xinghualingensis]|uniref:LysM peptidoglycan-binding domain-containing protein n=1 Tax=Roseomonas xinghualingensis TaxID=2986475 RepID=UPI0021F200A9|nr:LysM peptidoglycan-binding domain-containing protein [Roseomonas sp. SXEYE001]MCV4207500.1 LysM peptidoglycan-binding domain-containing protein [Roseomonas sp. SXEYE001]
MTDASRLRVVGGVAALACAVAAGAFYGTQDLAETPSAFSVPRTADPAEPRREAAMPAGAAAASAVPSAQPGASPTRAAEPPRFDVVRMSARGSVVVAGRAAPGAEVALHEGGREIGRARADARGEWVILPADPLGAGARELSLRARAPGGEEIAGQDTVLVVGPAEPQTLAQAGPRPGQAAASRGEQHAGAGAGPSREAAPNPGPARSDPPLVLLLPPTAEAAPRALSAPPAGEAQAPLGLDVVDYDDSNAMRFAGTAPAGAHLRVYANDRHLGDTEADSSGRWSLTPAEPPPIGRHTLRVDQMNIARSPTSQTLAPRVASRIEVAFQRESLPANTVRGGRIVVQPGNSLWRIAREAYGRGTRYTVLYRANQGQIRDPNLIFPGQVFAVPVGG